MRGYYPSDAVLAERNAKADKVMRDLIEALKPHNIILRFPNPEEGQPAVEADIYGENLLPGHAFLRRPGTKEKKDIMSGVSIRLDTDGTDDLHNRPFHMEVSPGFWMRRNRNAGKFRFKIDLTPTTAMVNALVEAVNDNEKYVAQQKADNNARLDVVAALKAADLLPPKTAPYDAVYKDFSIAIHEGHFMARWSSYQITPHQMTCILAGVGSALQFNTEMLDTFDAHGLALKVTGDAEAINLFKTVAGLVEGCANAFGKTNKAK